uniref:Uncharacterized protein n=1 Tax=Tetranychus urticae TaxID=32264 RepID=T1KL40_TETUR
MNQSLWKSLCQKFEKSFSTLLMTIMKLLEYKSKSISSTILGFTSIIFTTLFSTSLSLSLSSSPLSSFASTHLSTLPYTHQTDGLSSSKFCAKPSYLPTPTSLTALASFPGSGNTWIRYLIQQSSV